MKIKTDFVTNSSSASFIIALKASLTVKDIEMLLLEDRKRLGDFITDHESWHDDYLVFEWKGM